MKLSMAQTTTFTGSDFLTFDEISTSTAVEADAGGTPSVSSSFPIEIRLELWHSDRVLQIFLRFLMRIFAAAVLICLLVTPGFAQVVALGGSNTAGKGVSSSESYPGQLQAMLQARGSNLRVINAGVSGDTTSGILARLGSDVPEGTRIVILQIGGNDFKRKNAGAGEMHEANIASIRQQLRSRGIRMVDAQPLIRSARAAGLVQADQVHLTAEGYRRVAAQLLPSIR